MSKNKVQEFTKETIDIKLDIDDRGQPHLVIKHHDRSTKLYDKLLGKFIRDCAENGIDISKSRGYLEVGTDNSFEIYKISPK